MSNDAPEEEEIDPYVDFTRDEWSRLRASTPLSLAEDDLAALRGLGEPMPMAEVEDVYLPLSRLLNLNVAAARANATRSPRRSSVTCTRGRLT